MRTDMAQMLSDIDAEIHYTRTLIGRDAFAPRVMAVMAEVPRHLFVPEGDRDQAYANGPLPIGWGQTISQPYIVALMTDLLACGPDDRVLEIGTGSGYQAAVLSRLVGQVYSLEIIPQLATAAAARLARLGYANVRVRQGDGHHGWPEQAPFDGILVTAAAEDPPGPLLAQLKPGGIMVVPVGQSDAVQHLIKVTRGEKGFDYEELRQVRFVPLVEGLGNE